MRTSETSSVSGPSRSEAGQDRSPAAMSSDARVQAARQSVEQASRTRSDLSTTAPMRTETARQAIRGDVAPAPIPVQSPAQTSAQAPAPGNSIARAQEPALGELARLSQAVYGSAPPQGWSAATPAELGEIGLSPTMLRSANSDFQAQVYVDRTSSAPNYVVSFRGTTSANDWSANARQSAGLPTDHYNKALELGDRLNVPEDARVTITGHSLGGGLASTAALAAERDAVTFNAAGLSNATQDSAARIAGQDGTVTTPDIRAYHVRGEILSALQDGGDRVAGGLIGNALSGPWGGVAGAAVTDLPEAVGTRIEMQPVRPEGMRWYQDNPVSRHLMDYVIASVDAR